LSALILIIENDQETLELMEFHFAKEGFQTVGFLNTKKVIPTLLKKNVDLIVMNRTIHGEDGSKLVGSLRKKRIETFVMMLSQNHIDEEVFQAFERGCDDYISKPFTMKELVLRVKAILRRTQKIVKKGVLIYRDILLDSNSRIATINGLSVDLTKLEFDLLHALMVNQNIVLTREYLLKEVWGSDTVYKEQTVNVAITRLKEKIDPTKTKDYIKSLHGVGYNLH
jgi:DNA-binding response OmpR family regulator